MRKSQTIMAMAAAALVGCAHAPAHAPETAAATPRAAAGPAAETPTTFYCNGIKITKMLLDNNPYNLKYKLPGPMEEVKYITIHNTANKAPALDERNYLNNRRDNVPISFHYAVDENGAIQILPLDTHGWHAADGHGEGNMKSIGIEICRSTIYGNDLYPRSEENAVKLTAYLLYIYHLTPDDMRMHNDWYPKKKCPYRIIEDNRWPEFKARVAASLDALKR